MKVVINAPGAVDKDGKPLAVGQEVDLDDETATALRMDGKAALPYDPKAQPPGVYNARASREGAAPPPPAQPATPINKDDGDAKKK